MHTAVNGRRSPKLLAALLTGGIFFATGARAQEDPPEVTIGERLFLETRFAQAFRAFLDRGHGVNDPMSPGDPVMAVTATTGAPLPGPFAGSSMNCRACHLVDEHVGAPAGGMRSYNDFARRSPIPRRTEDNLTVAPRNSPPLVNASLPRLLGPQFHFDAEFASLEDLVAGTLTGRNYGWLPTERRMAVATVARVIREDNGRGELAQAFGGLSYATVLTGTLPAIPPGFRLPSRFRVNVARASDEQIFEAVNKLIAAYTEQLVFSQDDKGSFNLSPFDVFLAKNGLPRQPAPLEPAELYSRRLMLLIDSLDARGRLQFVTSNPNTPNGQFEFHAQSFQFGRQELQGLRIFMKKPAGDAPSPAELAAGGVGNCAACHAAPNFTDFGFHNTGTAQDEYDRVHGTGAFATLPVPSLAARNANINAYLPATERHPFARGPFRAVPDSHDRSLTDLGVWNVFANPDFPEPQIRLGLILCNQALQDGLPLRNIFTGCAPAELLPHTIAIFKTPGLRDLSHSAPYMHTGRFDTLADIVAFYQRSADMARGGTLRNAAKDLSRIALGASDVTPLVAFLKSLNEDYQ